MTKGLADVARQMGVRSEVTETSAGATVTRIPADKTVTTRQSDNGRFAISSNIPMPEPEGRAKRGYPWEELRTGESFFMPGGNKASNSSVTRANKLLSPRVFDSRKWTEKGVDGIRVWRVK